MSAFVVLLLFLLLAPNASAAEGKLQGAGPIRFGMTELELTKLLGQRKVSTPDYFRGSYKMKLASLEYDVLVKIDGGRADKIDLKYYFTKADLSDANFFLVCTGRTREAKNAIIIEHGVPASHNAFQAFDTPLVTYFEWWFSDRSNIVLSTAFRPAVCTINIEYTSAARMEKLKPVLILTPP